MDTYRIDVGRDHGVQVKNIVGAIANEADISSKFIGDIRLFNEHSTVQLPKDMPADVLGHFKNVFICKRPMNMTLSNHPADQAGGQERDRGFRGERNDRGNRSEGKRSFRDNNRGDRGGDRKPRRDGERKERRSVSFTA
jgi:ATP-dependent RNA helicase DeaD